MSAEPRLGGPSRGVKILMGVFAAKLVWDVILVTMNWPDHSRPKLGIAIVLPVILWGLARGKNWAMIFAGVVCTFWIVFVVAQVIGPIFVIGEVDVPFPWSNLLAFPAIVFVMNNLKTDEELRQSADS